jgi:hypothetical protein
VVNQFKMKNSKLKNGTQPAGPPPILHFTFLILNLVPVLLICVAGWVAALCGFERLDHVCRKLLTDTDGQEESPAGPEPRMDANEHEF